MDRVLCDELLEEVLHRLPPPSTFSRLTADVSLVSKLWLRLYRSSRSRVSLFLTPYNCTPPSLSSFLSHFPHLSDLRIRIDDDRDGVSNFSDQILLSVASSCPKLTYLSLKPKPVSLFPLFSLSTSCPHLTSLTIDLSRPFSFQWLRFFHSLQELDVFFINIPVKFDAAPSEGNFDGAELKLETLNFTGIGLGVHGFDGLWKSCKRLKKLQLNYCAGIGEDTSVSSFNNCLNGLQEVELRHCGSLVNDILTRLVENSTSLNSLIIKDHNLGSGEVLLQFITHSRCNLRKLDLSFCPLGNDHLLAISEKFRGLLSLRLDGFNFFTAELARLTTMAMSTKLEELALIGCDLVPGLLTTLGQSLRNLRKGLVLE